MSTDSVRRDVYLGGSAFGGCVDVEVERQFREFVAARSAALVRSAFLLTGDRGEAEDAVQAALIRVYLAWPRIRDRGAVEAYTRRVLLREVLSWRRRRRVMHMLTPSVPEVAGTADQESVGARDEVHRALLLLPGRQRAVVVLRFFDDLPEAQVADLLGISPGAVKTHTSRALARLRVLLAETSPAEEAR